MAASKSLYCGVFEGKHTVEIQGCQIFGVWAIDFRFFVLNVLGVSGSAAIYVLGGTVFRFSIHLLLSPTEYFLSQSWHPWHGPNPSEIVLSLFKGVASPQAEPYGTVLLNG